MDEIYKLHYHYVKVSTNIKRSSEFKSNFSPSIDCDIETSLLIYTGYLKVIDPISKSIILSLIDIPNGIVMNNILILGQHVREVTKLEDNGNHELVRDILERDSCEKVANHPYYKRNSSRLVLSKGELKLRQDEILSWLKLNRIPSKLDASSEDLVIADSVRIKPPFEHKSDYICPTGVILKRVKHLIDSRPKVEN